MSNQNIHIIISGGGTGGHVFPALSIANAVKEIEPSAELLFVGAKDRLEMRKVPEAGYEIIGLPISGIQRKLSVKNLILPVKLLKSLAMSRRIIKKFKPDVVVGVGGYASGPVLRVASKKRIPTLIQEQNSYAGITNRLLAKKAEKICVAYDGMEKYFPGEKIMLTGNPVRKELIPGKDKKEEAANHFKVDPKRRTILAIGGSLGAGSINNSIIMHLESLNRKDLQLIWQCGKNYYEKAKEALEQYNLTNVKLTPFINRMDLAYSMADVIISRAGAGTISELALVKKPVILVPSPNVAEDHQTRNALSLVKKEAAIMIKDQEAMDKLLPEAIRIIDDEEKRRNLSINIAEIGKPDSAKVIAEEVLKMARKK
jgi:UDP-N-acetylglucosamine--N-acetylmuramyl-(pentapeptide) pyrophosphoryl-undecaprenol N-acetylglucosamine transferase